LENGNIFDVKTLLPGLFEYEFVEKMFKDSWVGHKTHFGQGVSHYNKIVSVEKIFNCVLYEKFLVEFKMMLKKYKKIPINMILKHLFHGSGGTDPTLVYKSESGLDMRFSKPGMYGKGIYFAEQSSYSDAYAYRTHGFTGRKQIFLSLVLVGDSIALQPADYSIPPLKNDSQFERFDSIRNEKDGHYVVYDNSRCYPGYLITYE
jgi:hypothetical protein